MNHLHATLTPDYSEIAAKKLYLAFRIMIDGVSPLNIEDDDFDIGEFVRSTREDGKYFIWTCSCGDPGCGGYVSGIHVRTEGDVTYWLDKDLGANYSFDTNGLRALASALMEEIKKWDSHAKSNGLELTIWPMWSMKYLFPAINLK